MHKAIRVAQRLLSRRGESLLTSAVKDLESLSSKLDKAESALATEIQNENEDIASEREKLALREAKSKAALTQLEANRARSRRISDRVSDLVS